jgi:DNA polymerase-1
LEAYQVTPLQFIELKALMGDSADNIPGVPKVGQKTATELMVTYGSIAEIYAHIDEITKKSIQNTLLENRELAELSKVLATINTDAELTFSFEDAKIDNLYTKEAYEYFTKLEFKNMLTRFEKDISDKDQQKDFKYVEGLEETELVFAELFQAERGAYQFITEQKELLGLALSYGEKRHVFIPVEGFVTADYLISKMQEIIRTFGENEKVLATFDAKTGYSYFADDNISMIFDVKLAAYLINPLKSEYTVMDIANEYLQIMIKDRTQLFGKKTLQTALEEKREQFLGYVCFMSYTAFMSQPMLQKALLESGMMKLFTQLEMPLTYVLYSMEKVGIIAKADALRAYSEQLAARIEEVEKSIYEQVGETFNINSPKQLGVILFEKMGCKGGKKTKTGYSTAADVLEKLAPDYPVVNAILEYRGLTKLKSTYADGLVDYIEEDGRIHSNFNQMITATGRISSTEPNLQNIPMRMELGRLIRKVFVPEKGYEFMDADYSQIELRILAHMADDKELIEDYKSGKDIHRITASKVFHTPMEEVTDLQRRNAKAVNFGVVYGISSFGLSQDLSISRKEAAQYIDQYFETYKGIKVFLDKVVSDAKEKGYTETMFGRRRPIPELASSNYMQRQFGERAAMNAPIQGTAADIMKIAMVNVYKALKEQNLKSRLIVQVHDELLIETAIEEEEQVKKILTDEMKNAADLAVTLEIDLHTGKDWYEAK